MQTIKPGSKGVDTDIRELDLILAEVTLISQRTQLFDRFLHMRAAIEVEKIEKIKDSDFGSAVARGLDALHKDGLSKTSRLDQRVQELMGHYVVLEEFFIRRSIDKAMKIDEYERGNTTSSCVDDVFYILKKSSTRVISAADPDSLCAMINVFGQVLEADYINTFQKQLSTNFSSLETQDSKIGYMVRWNKKSSFVLPFLTPAVPSGHFEQCRCRLRLPFQARSRARPRYCTCPWPAVCRKPTKDRVVYFQLGRLGGFLPSDLEKLARELFQPGHRAQNEKFAPGLLQICQIRAHGRGICRGGSIGRLCQACHVRVGQDHRHYSPNFYRRQ